jgi:hypothetical protein
LSVLASASTEDSSQISQKDIVGWIVTLSATAIAAGALYYTAGSFREEGNAKYVLTLSTIDNELTKVETDAERDAHPRSILRRRWELNFLNTIAKIATLILLRRYPEDLKNYFELEFRWAKHLIQNSVEREFRENQYKKRYCRSVIQKEGTLMILVMPYGTLNDKT